MYALPIRTSRSLLVLTLSSLFLSGLLLPQNASADITSGLVGHWKFDEGPNPSAADSSGNGNTGTLVNGPTRVAGKIGQAIQFDGVDDYVDMGDPVSLDFDTNSFSISLWFVSQSSTNQVIAQKRADLGGSSAGWIYRINTDGKLRLSIRDNIAGGGNNLVVSNSAVNDGAWHHAVLIVDRANNTVDTYIDGVKQNTNQDISGLTESVPALSRCNPRKNPLPSAGCMTTG